MHVNQFSNDYSFEAKTAKLPHYLGGHQSNRSIFGIPIPDYGISEAIGGNQTSQGGSNLFGPQQLLPQSYAGNVQGASTGPVYGPVNPGTGGGGSSTGGGGGNNTQLPQNTQQTTDPSAATRGAIENTYNEVFAGLDRLAGIVPNQKENLTNEINSLFGSQETQIEAGRDTSQRKLDDAKTETRTEKASSLRELDERLRNQILAGQIFLGAKGAGDSSAVGRFSGALAKAGSRSAASVMSQANKIMGDIRSQESDLLDTFNSEMAKLEQWKATKLTEVSTWANNMLGQIEQEKVGASERKGQALASLEAQIMNQAQQRLASLDSAIMNYAGQLAEWKATRQGDLQGGLQILQQLGQRDPATYQIPNLPGLNMGSLQAQQINNPGSNFTGTDDETQF